MEIEKLVAWMRDNGLDTFHISFSPNNDSEVEVVASVEGCVGWRHAEGNAEGKLDYLDNLQSDLLADFKRDKQHKMT